MGRMTLETIQPTPFLKDADGRVCQQVRITIQNSGTPRSVSIIAGNNRSEIANVPAGESVHEIYIDEMESPREISFVLQVEGKQVDCRQQSWLPPRHWRVHVVQLSHHDVGYTDLASNVLPQYDRYLGECLEIADATKDFPDDARFRIVVEQAWSIWHFMQNAPADKQQRMADLIRSGQVELTAMFGNMTTELCGHEILIRTLQHSAILSRQFGVPLVSAEHNDITGFSWGLSEILTEAGIKIFCPGLPLYYDWGSEKFPSFWDEEAIFGRKKGIPGAFWWEAPTGKRILFWCNNRGCGGDCRGSMPTLADKLQEMLQSDYPFDLVRWPVSGGARDNSPYIANYVHTIREWNAKWAWPKLISSTNARFYANLSQNLSSADLPVLRGELPGQDYPVAATSRAEATAVNRNNHSNLPAAEALATCASILTDFSYPEETLFQAYEDALWHDEHTWGHHFPCGPAARTSELEKAVHAHRAAALSHDVSNKAMARIADHVKLNDEGIHLVVFNPLPEKRTDMVSAPLREIDNCGSEMKRVPPEDDEKGCGYLKAALLTDRYHVNPPIDMVNGKFDLVDIEAGTIVPYQILKIESPLAPVPYAAQRLGLGQGRKRYGMMETPSGLLYDLRFLATDLPPSGYRTYRLAPRENRPVLPSKLKATKTTIENDFYLVEVNPNTGVIVSILDKEAKRELVDSDAPQPFGSIVVRSASGGDEKISICTEVSQCEAGPICAVLRIKSSVSGHPAIEQTITLYSELKRIDFAANIFKDPTPLLETHLAFPFKMKNPQFKYETPLSIIEPVKDFLPGAYANRLAIQNWLKITGSDMTVLLSSLDAPIVSLGKLWPARISPAHSCIPANTLNLPPQRIEDFDHAWIYSNLFANNFGTNFSVSQTGSVLFRYTITSAQGDIPDAEAVSFGQQATTPLNQIFTEHKRQRYLPAADAFLHIEEPEIRLLACRQSDDGNEIVLHLWNPTAETVRTRVHLPNLRINEVCLTNLPGEDRGEAACQDEHTFTLNVTPKAIIFVRVVILR